MQAALTGMLLDRVDDPRDALVDRKGRRRATQLGGQTKLGAMGW
jgi:hypothetical protein